MRRRHVSRRRREARDIWAPLIGLGVIILLISDEKSRLGVGAILVLVVAVFVYQHLQKEQRIRSLQIADVDNMTGPQFEDHVGKLLTHRGFRVSNRGGAGDLGVDIIAEKNGVRYAVQVKRHQSNVLRRAISDAVAGIAHFQCHSSMVVTNSYFTDGAEKLARSNGCELVDRKRLGDWIIDFQQNSKIA